VISLHEGGAAERILLCIGQQENLKITRRHFDPKAEDAPGAAFLRCFEVPNRSIFGIALWQTSFIKNLTVLPVAYRCTFSADKGNDINEC